MSETTLATDVSHDWCTALGHVNAESVANAGAQLVGRLKRNVVYKTSAFRVRKIQAETRKRIARKNLYEIYQRNLRIGIIYHVWFQTAEPTSW